MLRFLPGIVLLLVAAGFAAMYAYQAYLAWQTPDQLEAGTNLAFALAMALMAVVAWYLTFKVKDERP